jgi:hypothetical protein
VPEAQYYPLALLSQVATKGGIEMTKDLQGRKWLLTINNPADKGLDHKVIQEGLKQFPSLAYCCMADEKGETYHTHIFFALEHATRFSTINNRSLI